MLTNEIEPYVAWLRSRKKVAHGLAPAERTVETYVQKVQVLARLTGSSDLADLCAVIQDREAVEQLVSDLAARCTPGTVRGYLYALLNFCEWAKVAKRVSFVAVFRSDVPPPNASKHRFTYTTEQVETMLSAARYDLRWWMLLATVADTGRRIGDVLNLRWEWFHLDMSPSHVELPDNKSRKQQFIVFTKRLTNEVYTDANISVLLNETRTGRRTFKRDPMIYPFPMTYSNCMKRLETHCARLGMDYKGFHNFRHRLITERLRNGMPIQAVSALAGHSSITTTSRYYDNNNALNYAHFVEDIR